MTLKKILNQTKYNLVYVLYNMYLCNNSCYIFFYGSTMIQVMYITIMIIIIFMYTKFVTNCDIISLLLFF